MASSAPTKVFRRAGKARAASDIEPPRRRWWALTQSGRRWRPILIAAAAFVVFTVVALQQTPQALPHPPAEFFSIAFWRYPVVTNEIRRLPSVLVNGAPGPNFHAVWIAPDGNSIWIGGDDGLLLHSRDGGRTWTRLPPDVSGASASIQDRPWSLIPSVEAATGDGAPQSAPANDNGSATQSPPNGSQAAPLRPAAPTNLTATPVATAPTGTGQNGSIPPNSASQSGTTSTNPANRSGTSSTNPASSSNPASSGGTTSSSPPLRSHRPDGLPECGNALRRRWGRAVPQA